MKGGGAQRGDLVIISTRGLRDGPVRSESHARAGPLAMLLVGLFGIAAHSRNLINK